MNLIKKYIFTKIVLSTSLCTSVYASDNEEFIKELLENSALINRIDIIESKILKSRKNIYIDKFASLYNKDELKEEILENLNDELNDNDVDYLLDWYASQTAVLIGERKKENISLEQAQELITNPKKFLSDKKRIKVVLEINDLLHISSFDYKITNMLFLLKAKQSGRENMTDIEKYYLSKPNELKRKMRNQSLIFLLYKFRDIENEKLNVYLDFLKTKSTNKFFSTYHKTFSNKIDEILEQTIE